MSKYIEIKNHIEKLQKEAEALRKRERAKIIANIKKAIIAFELSVDDLGLARAGRKKQGRRLSPVTDNKSRSAEKSLGGDRQPRQKAGERKSNKAEAVDKRSVVAPKYRDTATGSTWTGRGKQPTWLVAALMSGKKLEDFKI